MSLSCCEANSVWKRFSVNISREPCSDTVQYNDNTDWDLRPHLESRGEIAETSDDTLVQGVGALHTELQHHGVDTQGEHTQEDTGQNHPDLQRGLDEHPDSHAQYEDGGQAGDLGDQDHLPTPHGEISNGEAGYEASNDDESCR